MKYGLRNGQVNKPTVKNTRNSIVQKVNGLRESTRDKKKCGSQ